MKWQSFTWSNCYILYPVVISTHIFKLFFFFYFSMYPNFCTWSEQRRKNTFKHADFHSTERRQRAYSLKATVIYWFTMSIFISDLIRRLQLTSTTLIYPKSSLQET